MMGVRSAALGALLILPATGCYETTAPQGAPCDPAAPACPTGQQCVQLAGGFVCSTDGGVSDSGGMPDATPACSNGVQDNLESDIDCGSGCAPCGNGKRCTTSSNCAADSCIGNVCRLAHDCKELHQIQPALGDGAYTIDVGGTTGAVTTFCDMTTDGGGWTLVGKIDGRHSIANMWLVSSQNVASLTTATIVSDAVSCIDAVPLAVDRASDVRLSNSARDRWVRWPLPAGRTAETFWRHSAGQTTIAASGAAAVAVQRWTGQTNTCQQNRYGINPIAAHGGAFPYTSYNTIGNTQGGDACMSVGVTTVSINGFSQNGNGFDAPDDEAGWPNNAINQPVHVAVWLR
jgi:hypothetical protein